MFVRSKPIRSAVCVAMMALTCLGASVSRGVPGAGASTAYFSTLAPGSTLPSDAACAAAVRPAAEQRADNTAANGAVPPPGSFHLASLNSQNGYDNRSQALEARVSGNYTGTTDEIIQWAACKWGFDEDVVRAIAVAESNWHQNEIGDLTTVASACPPGYTPECPRSFGIHQVTWSSDPVGTFPWSRDSTAFNLDASLMVHRLCFEGYMHWLRDIGYLTYGAGDFWGCVGQWYSGNWHDLAAEGYVTSVKGYVTIKPWTQPDFSNVVTAPPPMCPCVRYDFEGGSTQGWYRAWGPVSVAAVTSPVHSGAGALALSLTPSGPDWPGVQVSNPPGLASGMVVTYWVYAPATAVLTSVQPYVADGNWNDLLADPMVLAPGWNQLTWTVPPTNGIAGIGLVINDDVGWNGQLTLDSVSW